MHPKSPAKRSWGIHRANILPPRGVFAVRSPRIMHGAQILPPSGDPAPAQGLLPEQLHHGIAFQRPGPCAGTTSHAGRGSRTLLNGLALAQGCLPPSASPVPATCRYPPLAMPVAARDKPPMSFGGDHPAHGLQSGQAPRGRRLRHLGVRPITECCAELGLDSRTVNKWAQNRRRRPQDRPGLRQRCRKTPIERTSPSWRNYRNTASISHCAKKPTPGINPRVSFIYILSCIQPIRVSSCFTLGTISAGMPSGFQTCPS